MTALVNALGGQLGRADELLARALRIVRDEAEGLIESHSNLRLNGVEYEPVPGTIMEPAISHIADYVQLCRDIAGHLRLTDGVDGAAWFDDLLARRNGWEGSPL